MILGVFEKGVNYANYFLLVTPRSILAGAISVGDWYLHDMVGLCLVIHGTSLVSRDTGLKRNIVFKPEVNCATVRESKG